MIFSDNYDKFRMAQITYNAELEKYPALKDIDSVTDFFGYSLDEINLKFKNVYDYLTTINTSSNKIVSYAKVTEDSVRGMAVLKALTEKEIASMEFLTTPSYLDINVIPNLNITYSLDNLSYRIASSNGVLLCRTIKDQGATQLFKEKAAYLVLVNNSPCVVVRNKDVSNSFGGVSETITDIVVDQNKKTVKYIRETSVEKSYHFPNNPTVTNSAYVTCPNGAAYQITKTNNGKAVVASVKDTPILYWPFKTKFCDFDGAMFCPKEVNKDEAKSVSRKFDGLISATSKKLGISENFQLSQPQHKCGRF